MFASIYTREGQGAGGTDFFERKKRGLREVGGQEIILSFSCCNKKYLVVGTC